MVWLPPGCPPPPSAGEALADVIAFGEDDEFQRALDAIAPASPPATDQPMSLTEDILAAGRAKLKKQTETFFGHKVEVRGLTIGARGELMDSAYTKGPKPAVIYSKLYPALLAATLHHPDTGAKLFTEEQIRDLAADEDGEVDRVGAIALKLSGLDAESGKVAAGKSSAASDG
jgi:hypothetical protein